MPKNPSTQPKPWVFILSIVAAVLIIAVIVGLVINNSPSKTDHIAQDKEVTKTQLKSEVKDGVVTLTSDKTDKKAKEVTLYEDFSCSYCAKLAQATDDNMKKAIEDGDLVVHIAGLNFLDRGKTGHSTKSLAAALEAAQEDADQYWALRSFLLENIEDVHDTWDTTLPESLQNMGIDSKVTDAAKNNTDDANSKAEKNTEEIKKVSEVQTPTLIHDGKSIDTSDTWVEDLIKG